MVLDDLILKEIRVSFLLFCLKKDAGDFSPTSKSIEPKKILMTNRELFCFSFSLKMRKYGTLFSGSEKDVKA
jgi:hypothetical protein